jgi:hypothetical protein
MHLMMYNIIMERKIAPVVHKVNLHQSRTDFAYWQSQPYVARIAALTEGYRCHKPSGLQKHVFP